MESKLKIKYGGGEGGQWLSNLIFCLENNLPPQNSQNKLNFHQNQGETENVEIAHFPEEPYKFFHGKAIFNIYLNWVRKLLWSEQSLPNIQPIKDMSIGEQFEHLACHSSYKLELANITPDLNFDLILINPTLFREQLFNLLDNHQITYTKNHSTVDQAAQYFRDTCIDTTMHFDNSESILWLGWCAGISKYLWNDWPLVDSIQEIQNFVSLKKDFYCDFTKSYMIAVDSKIT
jgi:hypothetical protein